MTHSDILTSRLVLRLLPEDFLRASLANEAGRAASLLELSVPDEWFLEEPLMRMRLDDLIRNPLYGPWSLRAIANRETGEMMGHIGFHTLPNAPYLRDLVPEAVELGYLLFEPYRGRGYAREAILGMMHRAHETASVSRFVVSISPDNLVSYHLATQLGFVKISSWIDEVDGPEDVLLLEYNALTRSSGD